MGRLNGTDLIFRHSAIKVIDSVFPVNPMKSEYALGIACGAALAKTYVEQLPSAHSEITAEDIREWCNKRSLMIIDNALYLKMSSSYSASTQSEIIRCKDCKFRDGNWRRMSVRWLPCMDVIFGDNWFCGYAEKEK